MTSSASSWFGVARRKTLRMSAPVEALLRQRNPRFLDGVDAADVKTILGAGTLQRFSTRSVMISQGYPAGHLFLLLTGRARRFFLTHDGQKIVLLRILSGDVFGEMAILDRPANYLVSTEATANSSALVWSRSTIRGLCERYPRLVHNSFRSRLIILHIIGPLTSLLSVIPHRSGLLEY
jgi:CRP-like cAMP-binding protein